MIVYRDQQKDRYYQNWRGNNKQQRKVYWADHSCEKWIRLPIFKLELSLSDCYHNQEDSEDEGSSSKLLHGTADQAKIIHDHEIGCA